MKPTIAVAALTLEESMLLHFLISPQLKALDILVPLPVDLDRSWHHSFFLLEDLQLLHCHLDNGLHCLLFLKEKTIQSFTNTQIAFI